MKIPLYRTQAQATSEAPGASIRARMDGNTFVRAELAKGEAFATSVDAVNKYTLARLDAEAKIQYNESLLAAEEEMRGLVDKYKDSSRLGDVINEKGTGGWQVDTKDIRDRLSEKMISRSMTDAFNARFGQQEIAMRFQLRDAIDTRIKARAAASAAARQKSLVAQMSDHRASPELLTMLLASNDAEMKSDVIKGHITPEMRTLVNQKMIADIASGATTSFVGMDPSQAIKLARALQLQDQVDAGLISSEDAAAQAGLGADAQYVLSVLQLAPRDVALSALGTAITSANKFDAVIDEVTAQNDKALADGNAAVYNSIFGVDPMAPPSADLSARLNPGALRMLGKNPGDPISGREYIDASTAYLDRFNYLSPNQRTEITTHKNPTALGPFAKESDPSVYSGLVVQMSSGTLTLDMLNTAKSDLSLKDYTALSSGAFSESAKSLSSADDQVSAAFRYNKLTGANDEASKLAEASYASVSAALLAETNARRASGNPMTSIELNNTAAQLVANERVKFKAKMQENLTSYAAALTQKGIPSLSVGNELSDLDAWYNGLAAPSKPQVSIYMSARAEIIRRTQMMQE